VGEGQNCSPEGSSGCAYIRNHLLRGLMMPCPLRRKAAFAGWFPNAAAVSQAMGCVPNLEPVAS